MNFNSNNWGTKYVKNGTCVTTTATPDTAYEYTFLRKVLNEHQYLGALSTIVLNSIEDDVVFVECVGEDISIQFAFDSDHNRAWKIVFIGRTETKLKINVINNTVYVNQNKIDKDAELLVRSNEVQVMNIFCARNNDETKYILEWYDTNERISKVTLDGGKTFISADEEATLSLPVVDLIEALRVEIATQNKIFEDEFTNVYNKIEEAKLSVLSWEE